MGNIVRWLVEQCVWGGVSDDRDAEESQILKIRVIVIQSKQI